ncbi:pyruvate/ketoisovalerate oxidoreductase, gamma subunit [Pyrolobus fumarii 1A]|uniref:pyruvate synthase n=1 Tax=Pyrolobus fumarii (strain DSM 11204 / 1A) TaxID=694429 RepID=G0ED21_PYRF1|nr:2-oxoacid:acceptor oxidoreductase family protein [Pyrolobus fumarii]AEM38580.1 pyruvate/ketoisovalerate oxidoreductase, gamma subunit [Pyrolobus fumarii 1A]
MRIELRWHGRGGQGAVTAAELLAIAAIEEGLFAQAFPEFGTERRGAPVVAYNRVADHPVYEREPVLNPDYVIVLDPSLPPSIYMSGLKREGGLIVNTKKSPRELADELKAQGFEPPAIVATVDATEIALRNLRVPIVNTAMLGAFVRVSGVVSIETVEKVVADRFSDRPHLVQPNVKAVREAYESVNVEKLLVARA